jgi:hypothetical protein
MQAKPPAKLELAPIQCPRGVRRFRPVSGTRTHRRTPVLDRQLNKNPLNQSLAEHAGIGTGRAEARAKVT